MTITPSRGKQAIRAQGPCRICDGPYAAHRINDTQMERTIAGDHIDQVAADYDTTIPAMVAHWHALIDVLHDDMRQAGLS